MQLMECIRLRVKDIEFTRKEIVIRDGKGGKDRITMLPVSLTAALESQLNIARNYNGQDRENSIAGVYMPNALDRKYPRAGIEWGWQ